MQQINDWEDDEEEEGGGAYNKYIKGRIGHALENIDKKSM